MPAPFVSSDHRGNATKQTHEDEFVGRRHVVHAQVVDKVSQDPHDHAGRDKAQHSENRCERIRIMRCRLAVFVGDLSRQTHLVNGAERDNLILNDGEKAATERRTFYSKDKEGWLTGASKMISNNEEAPSAFVSQVDKPRLAGGPRRSSASIVEPASEKGQTMLSAYMNRKPGRARSSPHPADRLCIPVGMMTNMDLSNNNPSLA